MFRCGFFRLPGITISMCSATGCVLSKRNCSSPKTTDLWQKKQVWFTNMSLRSIKAKSLGRLELLEWINSLLEADYSKVEHLGDGVAYMQILDAVHPTLRSTHLIKINFNARTENQRKSNLRVVQEALVVSGVAKDLPVKQLARCKFADNISMLQWCYAWLLFYFLFFLINVQGTQYVHVFCIIYFYII